MKNIFVSIVLASMLAACASEQPKVAVVDQTANKQAAAAAATETAAAAAVVDELNDSGSILATRSTYYPFDVSAVQDADKPVVQAHAKYLRENPDRNVQLEGNCDERGSNEYNLGLGQRRADGVKKMLILGGAKASQINTVSYGEEKPRAAGHNESSWKQNRRTDIVY